MALGASLGQDCEASDVMSLSELPLLVLLGVELNYRQSVFGATCNRGYVTVVTIARFCNN
jgi:hypothetical protein